MDENKITAAILTFALWNNREKERHVTEIDWQHVVDDYSKIVAELYDMDRQSKAIG